MNAHENVQGNAPEQQVFTLEQQSCAQSFIRQNIATLPAYVAGKNSADPHVLKVASNEMPFPTLPGVHKALCEHLANLGRYPNASVTELTSALAQYHQIPEEMLTIGNGSVALIEKIVADVAASGDEVIMPWRSFEAYPIAVQLADARAVQVPLAPDASCDFEAMLDAVTEKTRAILVCTPNNPTGGAAAHTQLSDFIERVPSSIPVIIDEAYVDFVRMSDPVRGIELAQKYPNAIVLRTFSKAYGLAGLRIGYAISESKVTAALRASNTPFGVNTLAQVAAKAALAERSEVDRRVNMIVQERENVQARLRELGWSGPESQANFVWFDYGAMSEIFDDICLKHGIIVRTFKGEGVRVTIAEPEANQRLIEAYEEWASSEWAGKQ